MNSDGEMLPGGGIDSDARAKQSGQKALEAARIVGNVAAALRLLAKNLQNYAPIHPAAIHAADDMVASVSAAAKHFDPVVIEITDAGLAHRTVPLYEVNHRAEDLAEICRAKKIGRLVFRPALSSEEAMRFVQILWKQAKGETDVEAVAKELSQAQVANAQVQAAPEEPGEEEIAKQRIEEPGASEGPRIGSPRLLYRALGEAVKEIYAQAKFGADLPTHNARELCRDVGMHLAQDPLSLLPLASARR